MKRITTWRNEGKTIATNILNNNGLILFPADTIIGLATQVSKEGITKLDLIKNRQGGKNYALIVDSVEMLEKLVEIDPKDKRVIIKNTPDYFTFVIRPKKILESILRPIISANQTIGFRIPKSPLMIDLCRLADHPLIATSANRSGEEPVNSVREALEKLQNKLIDLVIDIETDLSGRSSTVVDLAENPPKILRQGSGIFKKKLIR
jgi:L-threonylcarbamoyladenylate synthase